MSAIVRRITIDEHLADDLIRVAICPLAKGVQAFLDREGDWGPERQSFVRPKDYVRKLGISDPEDWPCYFQVSRHRGRFERIDHLDMIRESIHQLYAHALGGGK
jgi:hypothetical protein